MNVRKLKHTLGDYAVLTLACVVFTFAWESFMIPNGMSSGGLVGLCTVVQYITGGAIQASVSYIVINVALILLSILVFGIGFGFKTLYCIALNTALLQVFGGMEFLHAIPGQFLYVREPILIPIIAGVLEAVGVGLTIKHGGSTGGTDIVALMVNKYWPVSLSRVFLFTDFVIIFSLLIVPGKTFADMVYGFEMMVTFSLVIDWVIGGARNSYQVLVFSEKYKEIADHIIYKLERGVTVLKAQGWYTKKDKDVLLILISQSQMPQLTRAIKEIDSKAFMSVGPTNNVYGEGFEEIKAGITPRKKQNTTKDEQ